MKMNEYVGDNYQLCGAYSYERLEGKAKGMTFYHLKNGKGLEMDVSLDRNADISSLSFKGINLSYLSPCGYVASSYYDDKGDGFLKSFTAGFLTTCGLTTFGSPSVDAGESLPLHGTIANTPCSHSFYLVNEDEILVHSLTKDETIFTHKLVLKRKIAMSLSSNRFILEDQVINNGDKITPLMLLYHINLGYPFLDGNLLLHIPSISIRGRTPNAEKSIETALKMEKPTPGYVERCYYHKIKNRAHVYTFNKKLNIGLELSFDTKDLPCFTEWKMMGIRDYVLGIEPGTNYPDGRAAARKENVLSFLAPGEEKKFRVEIEMFEGYETYQKLTKEGK